MSSIVIPEAKNAAPTGGTPIVTRRSYGWAPFDMLRQEMDRVFDHFGDGSLRDPLQRMATNLNLPRLGAISPAVDVKETDNAYELSAELAGLDEKDVQLMIDGRLLTISGEKSEENQRSENSYHVAERRFGAFTRSFRIPDNGDAAKIDAKFAKGVLTITIPKLAEAKKEKQTIAVKAAA